MRLKKLIIGVFLITAVVCGGVDLSGFSTGYNSSPKAAFLISSPQSEELTSQEVSLPTEREVSTELRYNFTLKISHRFNSFPPRASPPSA